MKEYDLYNTVLKWSQAECSRKGIEVKAKNIRTTVGNAIYQIRFASTTLQEFGLIESQSSMLTLEVWNMSDRKVRNENLLRCCRFFEYTDSRARMGRYALCVSFNKTVKFHGVRLLGGNDEEYDVKLNVFSHVIEKKCVVTYFVCSFLNL